jgi:hypothetical protein
MESLLSGTSVTVHINTADTKIERHTEHNDGRTSYTITGREPARWDVPTVYLTGSPQELVWFAQMILAAVLSDYDMVEVPV